MGKFRASLLSIVFQLFLISAIFANENVKKVQEELRKRHLFFGTINGQTSPALTAALAGYQARKGFARTGVIDSQTLESLGLVRRVGGMPFVVDNSQSIRGPNGERLPLSAVSGSIADERPIQFEQVMMAQDRSALALAGTARKPIAPAEISTRRFSASRVRPTPPPKETNPLAMAFHHAVKFFAGDADPKKKRSVARRL